MVHRDLKPANIMIDEDDHAVIMDFGIARSGSGTGSGSGIVGTLDYMAPEQAQAKPTDHRADIYAFGMIMRDMLLGRRVVAEVQALPTSCSASASPCRACAHRRRHPGAG